MRRIDEERLENGLAYRMEYVSDFMALGDRDGQAMHHATTAPVPLVPSLVDAIHDRLFACDATQRHFVRLQSGCQGQLPAHLERLTQNHEMIQFRKNHLRQDLLSLIARPYDGTMIESLDCAGKMHTPTAGSPEIHLLLVQMKALMGFVSDAITATILGLGPDRDTEIPLLRAFIKLLRPQNDQISRHYREAQLPVTAA